MIAYIKGRVVSKEDAALIIDVCGLGYRIAVTDALNHSSSIGAFLELHLHYHLRENTAELYGFSERGELELFKLLLNVSGIGPKTALNVLNASSADAIRRAISAGDAALLKALSGIGAKTAERIIIELKGKVGIGAFQDAPNSAGDSDIVEALVGLGYSQGAARSAVGALDASVKGIEERLKCALQYLGKSAK